MLEDSLKGTDVDSHGNKLRIGILNSEIGQFSDTLKENRREYENVLMMKEKGGVDNILSGYEQALRQSELIYLKLTQDVQMINGNLDD